jgi:NADH dehydrogenase
MATVARFRAIVDFKGIRVAGFIGWIMWAFVHLTCWTGFKNRFFAGFGWVLSFVGSARHQPSISWPAAKRELSPTWGEAPTKADEVDQ